MLIFIHVALIVSFSAFYIDFNYINSVALYSRSLTEHSSKFFCVKCECCNLITCYRIHGENFLWLLSLLFM